MCASKVPSGMKVLVCGGRKCWEWAKIARALDGILEERPIGVVITGGATGADTVADRWAETRGIQRVICPAAWNGLAGRAAGHFRNRFMLSFEPDLVVAFPGGPGTRDMVEQAKTDGVFVMEFDGEGKRKI